MNKKLFVLSAFSSLILVACPAPEVEPEPEEKIAVTSVSLDKKELAMISGETDSLTATITPENATDKTLTWTTEDENVAYVDAQGGVSAFADGETTITVASVSNPEANDQCVVTVGNRLPGLDEAISALGDHIKFTSVRAKGVLDEKGEKTTEAATFNYVQTPKYNYFVEGEVGVGQVGDSQGAYFPIYKDGNNYKVDWGKYYYDTASFLQGELLSTIVKKFIDSEYTYAKNYSYNAETNTFAFIGNDAVNEFSWRLGVGRITSKQMARVNLKVEDGVATIEFYQDQLAYDPAVTVTAQADGEAGIGELDAFLLTAEPKESGIDAEASLKEAFYNKKYYTSSHYEAEYNGTAHEYVTKDTFTTAYDEGFDGVEVPTMQYAYAEHKVIPTGLYTSYVIGNNPKTLKAAIAEEIKKEGDIEERRLDDIDERIWISTAGYKFPITGTLTPSGAKVSYNGHFRQERADRYGQCYMMEPGYKFTIKDSKGADVEVTTAESDLTDIADLYDLFNVYDSEYPYYSGYTNIKWTSINLYISYDEGETPSDKNAARVKLLYEFDAQYKSVVTNDDGDPIDKDGNVIPEGDKTASKYQYTITDEHVLDNKQFYNFGTTVDPYADIFLGNIEDLVGYYFVGTGEDKHVVDSLKLNVGDVVSDISFEFANEGFTVDALTSNALANVATFENNTITAVAPGSFHVIAKNPETNNKYYLEVEIVSNIVGKWFYKEGEDTSFLTVGSDLIVDYDGYVTTLEPVAGEVGKYTMTLEGADNDTAYVEVGIGTLRLYYTFSDGEWVIDVTYEQFKSTAQKYAEAFAEKVVAPVQDKSQEAGYDCFEVNFKKTYTPAQIKKSLINTYLGYTGGNFLIDGEWTEQYETVGEEQVLVSASANFKDNEAGVGLTISLVAISEGSNKASITVTVYSL